MSMIDSILVGRRWVLASAIAAVALAAPSLAAAAESWRLSSMMTNDSFEGKAYARFAELADKYTQGRVSVRVYPNEQLGNMEAVIEQLSKGLIQVVPSASNFLSRWAPGIKFAGSPFLFKDYAQFDRFINSELFKGWLKEVEDKAGIMILGNPAEFPRGSYRVILSKKPINTPADFKGLKIRQYQDKLVVDAWTYLGAEVRVLPWGEVYDGINRGLVEAVTSPAELIESMKFYEVAPHVVRTDEYPQAVFFMMNAKAYRALSPADQAGLQRAYSESAAYARELIKQESENLVSRLKAKGATFKGDFDVAGVTTQMAKFYKSLADKGELPKGFVETIEATAKAGN